MRDLFELAVEHHQAGQLEQAERLYKRVLASSPSHADAVHNLGVIALQSGRNDLAVILLRRAIKLAPSQARGYSNLGNALVGLGQMQDAIIAYQQALAIEPDHRDALCNLGVALMDHGRHDEAISIFRWLILKDAGNVEAYYNLSLALMSTKSVGEAIRCCQRAILLRPSYIQAHNNLGILYSQAGQPDASIAAYRDAIAIEPRYAQAHNNLGNVFSTVGRRDDAIAAYRQAIALNPALFNARNSLGFALWLDGKLDEAIDQFRQAISVNSEYADAHGNLGVALKDAGHMDEAIASIRRALTLNPKSAKFHSILLMALQYDPRSDLKIAVDEARLWDRLHGQPDNDATLHTNVRSTHRLLRVGYVSADLREHVVGRFLMPIVQNHESKEFEVHLFSNGSKPDGLTHLLKQNASGWYEIGGMNDAAAVELIKNHHIDLLVDLSLHSSDNRLLVFAHKPTPVQLTHLAYCSTSGMSAMDYVIADRFLCPPGSEPYFVERIARLPGCYWCYCPLPFSPNVSSLPALRSSVITFGCLNNFGKISAKAFEAWTRLMLAIPNSRLVLHAKEGSHRQRVARQLAVAGIDPRRLSFASRLAIDQYLDLYHSIDICLDPFPFCGGTTTCDALWMGVPVVSLAGETPVGRGGLSILSNIGLPELVATSTEEYIRIAVELAGDLPRLAKLRATMRERMQNSPLMDERQYVRDLEALYRQMWVKWCESTAGQAPQSD